MRTNEARWSMDKDGAWVSFRASSPAEARQIAESVTDGEWDVDVKRHREKRSRDANAYLWVLCDKIGAVTMTDKVTVYREAIRSVGVNDVVCVRAKGEEDLIEGWANNGIGWFAESLGESKVDGCKNVILYYGSSTYNTKEMSRLIDYIVAEAKDLGITTETPEELAKLKEEWR